MFQAMVLHHQHTVLRAHTVLQQVADPQAVLFVLLVHTLTKLAVPHALNAVMVQQHPVRTILPVRHAILVTTQTQILVIHNAKHALQVVYLQATSRVLARNAILARYNPMVGSQVAFNVSLGSSNHNLAFQVVRIVA